MHLFKISKDFVNHYKSLPVKFGPVGLLAFARTYSRPKPDGSQETWAECCERVVNGVYTFQMKHCDDNDIYWNQEKADRSAEEMYKRMWEMKFTPPGRGLWTMGTDFLYKNGITAAMNCAVVDTNSGGTLAYTATFIMDLLLHGVGVGVAMGGEFLVSEPTTSTDTFTVGDSREGWTEALSTLIGSFTGDNELPSSWDFSKIRPAGTPLKGFGGVASGYKPLEELLERVTVVLTNAIGGKLSTTGLADIINMVGCCVVTGGIRRSAILLLGDPKDQEFLDLKVPGSGREAWQFTSNNTVIADDIDDFTPLAEKSAVNGEPAYLFLDTIRKYGRLVDPPNWKDTKVVAVNACAEIGLEHGETCNLTENYINRHDSKEDFLKTLKYSYLYSKTVSLIKSHRSDINEVIMRNRRIGASLAGILPAYERLGEETLVEWLNDGYLYLQEVDATYSDWFEVNRSIKTTTVKPGGSTPLIPGETPGLHADHSPFYIRRVTVNASSPLVDVYKSHGYKVEQSVYLNTSVVIEIPVKSVSPKTKKDYSIEDQVKFNALIQRWWSDNSCSQTVNFSNEEAPLIGGLVQKYRHQVKSLSFLPDMATTYEQLPYEEISESEYNEMVSGITEVLELEVIRQPVHDIEDEFCTSDSCTIKRYTESIKA